MKKRLNDNQRGLHFALWNEARAILWPAQQTWPKVVDDERRHEFYLQVLGEFKSYTEFTEFDFDKVKGALLAIIKPDDLNAQLHALNGQRKRLLYGIGELSKELGVDEFYVQGIIDRMDARRGDPAPNADRSHPPLDDWERERERSERPQRRLQELHPRELVKVLIALRQHERRGMVHQPAVGQSFTQESRDHRRHHALVGGPDPF